ncbi:PREDICTED: anosmin-1-like [Cyprinodon variegatus]|uniref:anosmin-1-like n=1 Tax=Cyprinodon variegatus TaxID=28743 RepID=UPI000742B170|nr:PREDICTED: anosmin-1-like [Cyprinodon variegatus]
MSAPRAVLVLLCVAWAVARARRSSLDPEDVQEKVNSARCTSRCLSLHMTQLTAAFRHIQNNEVLVWCENHRRCAQCLHPCKELWETRKVISPKLCEKQTECVTSREFLASLRSSRQGDCPPPQRATGFAAACVESCSFDQDCPTSRKCCFNGCGHTCQAPANLYKGVPLKPRREMSFLEDPEGRVKVAWLSKFNVSMEPVIYMLQSRWNIGIHPSEDHASPWATVVMTLSEDAVLSDLRPQRWYQFRVAAINSHGSRGFTTPSKHYISSKDPSPPEPPTNLKVSNQSLEWTDTQMAPEFTERLDEAKATAAVLLQWEPPREGDLPVHNYRITWTSRQARKTHKHMVQTYPQTELTSKHMHEQGKKESNSALTHGCPLLQGEDISNELPSSSSSSSLPSSPSQASSSSSSQLPKSSRRTHVDLPPNPSENLRLEVAAPHFHNNQLQVKVFWKRSNHNKQRQRGPFILRWHPHTCSTNVTRGDRTITVEGKHHTIKGLQFACKYRVSVAMAADPKVEAVAWVTTPTCSSFRVRGDRASPCSKDERPLAGRKVVLRPERLTADFHQVNGTLLTTFRWRMSHHAVDSAAVEGFQFTWSLQPELSPAEPRHEDALISQTQTIALSERSITVDELEADSVYRVQLQVLTTGGRTGAAVSKSIHTPAINNTFS